ncbi:hypothetical protein ACJ73_07402, partial [Blastomyces percursus]
IKFVATDEPTAGKFNFNDTVIHSRHNTGSRYPFLGAGGEIAQMFRPGLIERDEQ